MPQRNSLLSDEFKAQNKRTSLIKTGLLWLIIFTIGWIVGSGRIQFTKDGLEYKPGHLTSKTSHSSVKDNSGLPQDLDYASVENVYDVLRKNYDGKLELDKLLDGMKQGLAEASGDPYTQFFNPKDAKSFDEQLNGSFVGIGAELGKDDKDNLIIVAPISGFPAEKAGLRPRDILVKIDGTSTYDMQVEDAVKKIRGDEGTKVKLDIVRDSEALAFEITRAKITIPSVVVKTLDGNIGYLQIARFAEDTSELATKAAQQFKADNVNGVILDLRGDPGGLLDAAVNVSSLWLKKDALVLQEKRAGKVIESFKANGTNPLIGVPTIVLIDEGSASASEITAGALKDNEAASLVGVKSFGKGSVQELQPLASSLSLGGEDSQGLLKVTIARWYTPAGKNIDKAGITPDVEVKRSDEDFKTGRDPQLDKALELIKK